MGKRSTHLALLIIRKSLRVELIDNLFRCVVLLDFTLEIEADHVAGVHFGCELKEVFQTLCFRLFKVLRRHGDNEMDVAIVMVLLVVLKKKLRIVSLRMRDVRRTLTTPSPFSPIMASRSALYD